MVASLRGRTSCLNGKKLTDIDSIGEKDGTLLIIDCKSTIYSSKYDIGDFKAVRNAQNEIIKKVEKWQMLRNQLKKFPIGDNYDFSEYLDILAVVCTPVVTFVPIGIATEEIEPKLRAMSSLVELEQWLGGDEV